MVKWRRFFLSLGLFDEKKRKAENIHWINNRDVWNKNFQNYGFFNHAAIYYKGLLFFLTVANRKLNKKVLLRERKRHTACRVASTPYVVLTGYPPPARVPPSQGTPPARVPPPRLDLAGYPLPPSCPMAFWEMLQSIMGYGYPPPPHGQTDWWTDACQNITFPSYYVRGR